MSEKHINKSLCESDSTKNPPPCEIESPISPLLREAESKSPLPCGGGLGVGIIPQHEGRLGVGKIGYKQTSIGIIPQDWEVVRLGEVGDIVGGGTPDTTNPAFWNGEILWLTPTEIKQKYISTSERKITQKGLENSSAKILPQNTILITTRATIGDIGIATKQLCTNQGFQSFVSGKNANFEFMYYLLCTKRSQFISLANGSTFLEVSAKTMRQIQIPLPPLKEQEKIARILGVWDSAIDSLANLIKAKRKYKTALMQRLLTPPKDKKSTHPLAPSTRDGGQENCSRAREGLSLNSTHCEAKSKSPHCESDFGKSDSIKTPLPCGGGLGVGIKTDKSPSHRPLAPYMKEFSRAMRKNPTQAENKLWQELRGKKLGFRFRRQFVIDSKYIADFVCLEKRLIIECDGGQHNKYESPHPKSLPQGEGLSLDSTHCKMESKSPLPQHEWDLGVGNDMLNHPDIQRDFYLESQNFRILRFWNNEILGNLEGVLCVIKEALESNVDFANAKYTCESTHPLAPSAREGEREVSHHTNEGEQENCPCTNEVELHQSSLRFAGFSDKWQEFRLGDLLKEKNIRNANNVNLVLSVTNKQGFVAQKDYFEQEVASNDTSNYKVVCRGEFAYNPARINVGSIAMLENFENGILSPMYIVFECLEKINKDFFRYWLESHNFRGVLGKYLSGSVRETLSFNDMKTMKIFIPTLAEQKKIAQVLSACDKEIETLNLKFECLKAQKKGLMQQLLSGKVRVKC